MRLDIRQLRRFDHVQLRPGPSLNLITGDNGAGKTSVLEALHLMAYGRSFRGRVRDGLVRADQAALEVFVEWREQAPSLPSDGSSTSSSGYRTRKAGLRHSGQSWSGRLDGANVEYLGELCAALAVVTFEPGSHALVTGAAEIRRRYLDWGLFHEEQDFLSLWRRYSRALKQRNALLKARTGHSQLDTWDHELASAGEPLGQHRQAYLDALQPGFQALAADMAPALGETRLDYQPGWRRDEWSLLDALLLARDRDLQSGFTSVGPHRADWRIHFGGVPGREALSRGQAKLTALAALFAQAGHYARARGEWPVIALDDLASELDRNHQQRVLQRLLDSGAQVFITGTESPPALADMAVGFTRFHVEHGLVSGPAGV
jgi:DNA replication and repair protein RecF